MKLPASRPIDQAHEGHPTPVTGRCHCRPGGHAASNFVKNKQERPRPSSIVILKRIFYFPQGAAIRFWAFVKWLVAKQTCSGSRMNATPGRRTLRSMRGPDAGYRPAPWRRPAGHRAALWGGTGLTEPAIAGRDPVADPINIDSASRRRHKPRIRATPVARSSPNVGATPLREGSRSGA